MKLLTRFAPVLMLVACVACTQPVITTIESDLPVSESSDGIPASTQTSFDTPRDAALAAASDGAATRKAAAAHLRSIGAAGVAAMKEVHGAEIAYRLGEGPATGVDMVASDRVLAAFDKVSGQRDGWASGLFWHTDKDAALAAAKDSGKPVLNLWLLGRLDDEFC